MCTCAIACICVRAHSNIHIPTLANAYTTQHSTDRNTLEAGKGKYSSNLSKAGSHTSRGLSKLSVAIPGSSGTWAWVAVMELQEEEECASVCASWR